jgi:MurNAc alpha-1-phosphate uridylyltransferase
MRNSPDAVMVFAAGFGARMKHLTQDRPKPMIPVAGKPLIDHALDLARAVNPARIVVNLHYRADMLERHLSGTDVQTIVEVPEILETGGGLRNALPLLGDGPVFTTNSDALWSGPNPLTMLAQAWNPDRMDGLLICIPTENTLGHEGKGDFDLDGDGTLTRGKTTIYGGVQIIKTDGLAAIAETKFSLNVLWDMMLSEQRLFGLRYPGNWCDVGRPEGIALAEGLLRGSHV